MLAYWHSFFRGFPHRRSALVVASLLLFTFSPLNAAEGAAFARLGAGAVFDTLKAGSITYQHVVVRSVNARTLMISHAGGMASVKLSDLSPELQSAFGYSPESAAAAEAALNRAAAQRVPAIPKKNSNSSNAGGSVLDALLQNFGQTPEIRPSVDLRPKFVDLALGVKNQGVRPSCAVFAIVSALEFQNAQLNGQTERFSEEYLIWATRKTLNRVAPPTEPNETESGGDPENLDAADEGFALSEVVTALRAYGIPLQSSLPYSFVKTMNVSDPPAAIVNEARTHRRVSVFPLPGRDEPTRVSNLIQALDAGVPVAVGIRWPPSRAIRSGFLGNQTPLDGAGHAVTIVGYENKTGAIEDTLFIFKNSWGIHWGSGGYGFASYRYLVKNLMDTAILEVEPAAAKSRG